MIYSPAPQHLSRKAAHVLSLFEHDLSSFHHASPYGLREAQPRGEGDLAVKQSSAESTGKECGRGCVYLAIHTFASEVG
jgi:hypothetical protein